MRIHGTTILAIHDPQQRRAVVAADGQATMNQMVIKAGANKIRTLYDGRVLTAFAGSTADAITLFERFEGKLKQYGGQLVRAAVELTKDWRTDRALRRLEALLLALDAESLLVISGAGEVLEPDDGIMALGSGGGYALAAARALRQETELPPEEIAEKALRIAAALDVYTNDRIRLEVLTW